MLFLILIGAIIIGTVVLIVKYEIVVEAVIVSILLFIAAILLSFIIGYSVPAGSTTKVETYDLQAIHTNNSVSGEFFLGISSMGEKPGLSFFYKNNDDNSYNMCFTEASKSTIIENSDVQPQVSVVTKFTNKWIFPFDLPIGSIYSFTIPENSIIQNYDLGNK